MSNYKTYYTMRGNCINVIELRETPNYLISMGGSRYRKTQDSNPFAPIASCKDQWFTIEIYATNAPVIVHFLERKRATERKTSLVNALSIALDSLNKSDLSDALDKLSELIESINPKLKNPPF